MELKKGDLIFRKRRGKWPKRFMTFIMACIVFTVVVTTILSISYLLEQFDVKWLGVILAATLFWYLYKQCYKYLSSYQMYSSLEDGTDTWTKITKEGDNS